MCCASGKLSAGLGNEGDPSGICFKRDLFVAVASSASDLHFTEQEVSSFNSIRLG